MKVLLLSDISSEHTQKWALGLASAGISVGIFSLNRSQFEWYAGSPDITVFHQAEEKLNGRSFFEKVNYIRTLRKLKKIIGKFGPDIVHAHYASSYGMLGALSGFHPFVLSVWGADVFDFPRQSLLHRRIFVHNLKKADRILSTSFIMKEEVLKYIDKPIEVTPFGVDLDDFAPGKEISPFAVTDIVTGSVKSLEKKYGMDVLVSAFALARMKRSDLPLKLLLVGGGSLEQKLKKQVHELELDAHVHFAGKVQHNQVSRYHRMIDIFVSVSVDDSESFGVSAVEACACEKAVIVARTGGLKEVVIENVTGIIVEPGNVEETADAILRFAGDADLRKEFGRRARKRALDHYNWKDNLKKMISIYKDVMMKKEGAGK